jgi:hypothetical protein
MAHAIMKVHQPVGLMILKHWNAHIGLLWTIFSSIGLLSLQNTPKMGYKISDST